jgi:hypothetical protein
MATKSSLLRPAVSQMLSHIRFDAGQAGLTREAIVVPISQLIVNKNWVRIVLFLQPLLHGSNLCFWYLQTRPSVPFESCCLGHAAQPSNQTTRGHGEGIVAII